MSLCSSLRMSKIFITVSYIASEIASKICFNSNELYECIRKSWMWKEVMIKRCKIVITECWIIKNNMNADDNRHLADVNNCGICIGIGTHSSLDILNLEHLWCKVWCRWGGGSHFHEQIHPSLVNHRSTKHAVRLRVGKWQNCNKDLRRFWKTAQKCIY